MTAWLIYGCWCSPMCKQRRWALKLKPDDKFGYMADMRAGYRGFPLCTLAGSSSAILCFCISPRSYYIPQMYPWNWFTIIPVVTNYSPLTCWLHYQTTPGQKTMSEPPKVTNYNPNEPRRITPDNSSSIDSNPLGDPMNAGPSNFK